jgi:hypothetical protein
MTLKLGELLLKEKMVTLEQLDEALKSQVFYGIKLGSSLIEMGYVNELALAKLLSKKLGVPCVGRKELTSVPQELVQNFPRQIIERFHVVPFKLEGNRLSVAMSDPTDLKAIEEIGFATGYRVETFIAPDVHISKAQAKYFNISSGEFRYQQVADQRRKHEDTEVVQKATITIPTFTETGELLNVTVPAIFEGFASLPGNEMEYADAMSADCLRYTVDQLSLDFAAARSRDDVANVFIKYLGQEFTTGALFIIRGNTAIGWRAVTSEERIAGFTDVSLLLSKPSVLRDVVDSHNFAMGALISTPENRVILTTLSVSPETSLLVLPIIMLKKVVAVVMVSADMEALGHRLTDLQQLVRKASLAFEMLIIKSKILLT